MNAIEQVIERWRKLGEKHLPPVRCETRDGTMALAGMTEATQAICRKHANELERLNREVIEPGFEKMQARRREIRELAIFADLNAEECDKCNFGSIAKHFRVLARGLNGIADDLTSALARWEATNS